MEKTFGRKSRKASFPAFAVSKKYRLRVGGAVVRLASRFQRKAIIPAIVPQRDEMIRTLFGKDGTVSNPARRASSVMVLSVCLGMRNSYRHGATASEVQSVRTIQPNLFSWPAHPPANLIGHRGVMQPTVWFSQPATVPLVAFDDLPSRHSRPEQFGKLTAIAG
jgi:hypothetical protein